MTRFLAGILMVFLLLSGSPAAETPDAQGLSVNAEYNRQTTAIYLKETVVPQTQNVKLRDITERIEGLRDFDTQDSTIFNIEKNRMSSLPLRSVRKALENNLTGPLILIGTRLRIMPVGVEDSLWFYESFMDHVEKAVSNELVHIQVDFVTNPETIPANQGMISWSIRSMTGLRDVTGGDSFIRWEKPGGGSRDRGVFDVKIHLFSYVWVPLREIRTGEIISEDLVEAREVDLSEFTDHLLPADEFSMFTALKNLEPGIPITRSGVTRQILVRAGETINITFVRKNLSVQMRGRALSTGGFDEFVMVRPEGMTKSFHGNVSGLQEVRIEFR